MMEEHLVYGYRKNLASRVVFLIGAETVYNCTIPPDVEFWSVRMEFFN